MDSGGGAVEFVMSRKGIGFTVIVSGEAIEFAAGRPIALDDRARWVEEHLDLFAGTADRIRPLLTRRGARIFVESANVAARGFAL